MLWNTLFCCLSFQWLVKFKTLSFMFHMKNVQVGGRQKRRWGSLWSKLLPIFCPHPVKGLFLSISLRSLPTFAAFWQCSLGLILKANTRNSSPLQKRQLKSSTPQVHLRNGALQLLVTVWKVILPSGMQSSNAKDKGSSEMVCQLIELAQVETSL